MNATPAASHFLETEEKCYHAHYPFICAKPALPSEYSCVVTGSCIHCCIHCCTWIKRQMLACCTTNSAPGRTCSCRHGKRRQYERMPSWTLGAWCRAQQPCVPVDGGGYRAFVCLVLVAEIYVRSYCIRRYHNGCVLQAFGPHDEPDAASLHLARTEAIAHPSFSAAEVREQCRLTDTLRPTSTMVDSICIAHSLR